MSHFCAMRTTRKITAVTRRFTLRSNPESPLGILNSNRRLLAVGALAASCMLASIPALPAGAETMEGPAPAVIPQTFRAASIAEEAPVTRDGYTVQEYTLVQWPVPSSTTMSSAFGYRSCAGCSSNHLGIDLNPGNGYPIQAIADGVVVVAEESSGGLGVHIEIEHRVNGETFTSIYGHMLSGSMTVTVGQPVSRGQQIGQVGNTGASTGAHLHFGIKAGDVTGTEIDPYDWLLTYANS